jgi:flagellar hook-associated protein 2
VDKYNELIDKIDKKALEKKNSDYQPLTDDQRQSLDDDQIKKWEEQARLGDLHSDSILTKVLSDMRSDLNNFVTSLSSGDIRQLSQIGIQTGAYYERGKLYIKDEAALRSALASNPEQVMRLFNYDDPTVKKSSQDGIAVRLFDRISDAMKKITDKAGAASATSDNSFVAKDLKDINKRISAMETTMTDKENRYYKKFSAMEQALSKFNSQSSSLSAFMTKN